ncbi:MAG TPA: hypothetical protein PKW80_15535 [Bacteroidales bacterium]|nr:hypothetical protein [Bacteroidales bacterium]
MEKELKSQGRCLYCDQMFMQKGIGKHLTGHLTEMEKADKDKPTQAYVHIVVEAWEMFYTSW